MNNATNASNAISPSSFGSVKKREKPARLMNELEDETKNYTRTIVKHDEPVLGKCSLCARESRLPFCLEYLECATKTVEEKRK